MQINKYITNNQALDRIEEVLEKNNHFHGSISFPNTNQEQQNPENDDCDTPNIQTLENETKFVTRPIGFFAESIGETKNFQSENENADATEEEKCVHLTKNAISEELEELEKLREYTKTKYRSKPRNLKKVSTELTIPTQIYSTGHVFYSGDLYKYHPGFTNNYIARYCRITRTKIFFYKNSNCSRASPPLIILKIGDIDRIKCLKNDDKSKKKIYLFEICLKPDWCQSRTILLNSIIVPVESLKKMQNRTEKVYFVDEIAFENTEDVMNFKDFVKNQGHNFTENKETACFNSKNPKKWIKSCSGSQTWNNRELEWFFAENRMLLATESNDERNRWIWILNWLLMKI